MAVYRCRFCGSVYDEEKEGTKVSELKVCPVCRVASDKMVPADGGAKKTASDEGTSGGPVPAEHVQPAPGPAAQARLLRSAYLGRRFLMIRNMQGWGRTAVIWMRFMRWR